MSQIFPYKKFGCAAYVSIYPQRINIDPQRKLGIYIRFESSSIIKYLELLTNDSFMTWFAYCHFYETIFPVLGGEIKQLDKDITWNALLLLLNFDHCIKQWERKVQLIFHLQNIANQLPNAFIDSKGVTKSYILVVNALA